MRHARVGSRLEILQIPDELTRFEHYWFIREYLAEQKIQTVCLELSDDLSKTDILRLDRALEQPLEHTQIIRKTGNTERVTAFLAGVHHCLEFNRSLYMIRHRRAGLFDRWRRLTFVQRAKPKAHDNRTVARFLRRQLRGSLWNLYTLHVDRVAHIKVPRKGEPPRFRLEGLVCRAAETVNLVDVHNGTVEPVHLLLSLPPL